MCYSRGVDDIAVQLELFEPQAVYGTEYGAEYGETEGGTGQHSGAPQYSGAPTIPRIAQSDDDFAELLRELETAERIAFDTETTGVDMTRCDIVGISLCTHAGAGWYVPAGADSASWVLRPGSSQAISLRDVLNRASATLAAHNAKFDLGVLKRHDMAVDRVVYDTMVAQFAVHTFARRALGMKRLAKE